MVATEQGVATFTRERWVDVEQDIQNIQSLHWEEIAVNKSHIPLDPDWELYRTLDAKGFLCPIIVRVDGRVVGYYISVVKSHPHYRSTLFGFLDSFFILPEYRKGTLGLKLFVEMEKVMREFGVQCLHSGMKIHHDVGPVFERLGWTPIEVMWTKWIGSE